MVQSLIPSPISSELEVYEWGNLFSHKFNNELHSQEKNYEFNYPVNTDEGPLNGHSPFVREEMENYQSQHHYTPRRSGCDELWDLIPLEIYKDIIYYQHRLLEIRCSEKYP